MPKFGLGMQIIFICFIASGLIYSVGFGMLLHIKKTEYWWLWEEDKRKSTKLKQAHTIALTEAIWQNPYWVRENRRAQFWVIIVKISTFCFLVFLGLPFILALFGIYLFD